MPTNTNALPDCLPPLTLSALEATAREVRERRVLDAMEALEAELIVSNAVPEGYSALIGHNTLAILTPNGLLRTFTRKDEFSAWEPD